MLEVSSGRWKMPKRSDFDATARAQLIQQLLGKEEHAVQIAR